MTTTAELTKRLKVVEDKLDIALRTIALMAASTQPAVVWMDATLAKVDDPKKIGEVKS